MGCVNCKEGVPVRVDRLGIAWHDLELEGPQHCEREEVTPDEWRRAMADHRKRPIVHLLCEGS